jgi:hypothetical protein
MGPYIVGSNGIIQGSKEYIFRNKTFSSLERKLNVQKPFL